MHAIRSILLVCALPLVSACAHREPRAVAPSPAALLVLRSQTRRCDERTAPGDSIAAHVVSGGEVLTPPARAGAPATLQVTRFATARLADTASRPRFDVALVRLDGAPAPALFEGARSGVEFKIRADSAAGIWYICLLPGSQLHLGDLGSVR